MLSDDCFVFFLPGAAFFWVADFFFAESRHFELLLVEFLRYARRQQLNGIVTEFFGSPAIGRLLSRFGFWQRPAPWNLLVYPGSGLDTSQTEHVLNADAWFLTRADVDTEF